MISALVDHIRRYVSLDEQEAALLEEYIEVKEMKKKAFLLKEGEVCKANYFLIKGCCRSYFITEKDAEHVHLFAIENWWITDYASLEKKIPSMFNIQTLEPSTLAILHRDKQDELFAAIPQLERYFRSVLETALAAAHMRIKYIYSQSGYERYHHFSTSFPDFVQRIPQYMLASYLGFTPEFLSKIRAGKIS
ncbi:Crp/Fnr family transcriptional regulator [Chitinophaga niabensis]|uniref:cAMP-binding domain of CRP or a regulatory subunit of cAMP-dependent protein kinases n=1 Tax=Chitinophaga niabensis TaxID=536979 RepID=A0A1N6K3T6_9BACT|nr:Crp/Fnr family transcriptional regulator [Chitinophaga niabensis]SIO51238.1 cAMP-binding domain of CRP or a regulatory subunit of cAMP-dependent protein kinases [Chitinophaga niabensis]